MPDIVMVMNIAGRILRMNQRAGRQAEDHHQVKARHQEVARHQAVARHQEAAVMLVLRGMLGVWIIKSVVIWKDIPKHHAIRYLLRPTFVLMITDFLKSALAIRIW